MSVDVATSAYQITGVLELIGIRLKLIMPCVGKSENVLALTVSEFGREQMPGFFVLGVFGVLAVGGEEDVGLVVGGGEGEDGEGVRGGEVGGEEEDVCGGGCAGRV